MKSLILVAVLACGLLAAAPAMGQWVVHAGPVTVQSYYPVGPVYTYPAPAPVVTYYGPPAVVAPVVAPAPVYVRPAGVWVGPRGRVRGVWW